MRRPPLNPEDAALWAAVAGTVRPISGRRAVERPSHGLKMLPLSVPHGAPVRHSTPKQRPIGETLDATWDKRLARGAAIPDRTVDLHGHSLASAHAALDRALASAIVSGARLLLVITGKAVSDNPRLPPHQRGIIRASIGDWLVQSRHAGSIAAVRNAHQRHGGAGALYVILRRLR
jgi:DNA-nicking Smr family endonuclease